MKNLLIIALLLVSGHVNAESEMVKNLRKAPENLCMGHPRYDECVVLTKKMIVAIDSASRAAALCQVNRSNLTAELRTQCNEFQEVVDFIKTLN
ncbi:hypothetical protein [Symbiopectobacterium purcellii]|uniref:Uncharacterized protein n=1 Tax=Symbiopectobacterium purcellii TaxID=2871826 RepID=A0ABX9ARN8_9ENTR|nr:hypothetical protein [Symbiopectobacterium purcellii]QZN97703.1 hypothetical protein K6K13_10560 [Symbiopectobacterium purcellii]